MRSGPKTLPIFLNPWSLPTQTVGIPSGVVSKDSFKIRRKVGSFWASITPCTPVTHTYPFPPLPSQDSNSPSASDISMALTPTPRTFARGTSDRGILFLSDPASLSEFILNPQIRNFQPVFQRSGRLPSKDLSKARIVAIAAAHTLRFGEVMPHTKLLSRDIGSNFQQVVDGDHPVGAQVEGIVM